MRVLVLESNSSKILFNFAKNEAKIDENLLIQLVTPILVSQRILLEEIDSQIQEIKLGSENVVLFSKHSYGTYTLIVSARLHETESQPVKCYNYS